MTGGHSRIVLRSITMDDTQDIIRWRNDPAVQQNFIYQQPFTEQGHTSWMENVVAKKKAYQYIIIDTATNTGVGSVFLRDVDKENNKAEFGIFIGEASARGCGIGTIAAKQILDIGFGELELNRIFLRVFANNTGAIKSYEKVGFTHEGVFRQDVLINGEYKDILFMAALREEYKRAEVGAPC